AGTFFGRWQHHVASPLDFSIPSALWGVLGISVGSTVLSMSVKATNDSKRRSQTAAGIPRKSSRQAAAAAVIAAADGTGPITDVVVAKAVAAANTAENVAAAKAAAQTNAVAAAKVAEASRAIQVVQPEQVAGDVQAVANAQLAVAAQAAATAQADQAAKAAVDLQIAATTKADQAIAAAEVAKTAVADTWKPSFFQIFMQEQGAYADEVVDVTKFQNFLLTVVLVIAYVGSVIAAIHHAKTAQAFDALPGFQGMFLILLAISHGAYLTGKAIPQQGDPQHNLENRPV
ncbi:MAG TPA: hypothetical protein VH298_02010, partial [Jatrophihabitans sp.]|nr:hypothetical protein [Jatrophihabitans sp.]